MNNRTIQEIVLKSCNILWEKTNRYPNLHLIISDQAKYMKLAVQKLKEQDIIFPNINHITCIIHAIDLICNQIRNDSTTLDSFLSNEKSSSEFLENARGCLYLEQNFLSHHFQYLHAGALGSTVLNTTQEILMW